jgi:hypothetical protein
VLPPVFIIKHLKFNYMKVGTKSVLFGAHCFLLHPWFVLAAWIKLYGFPLDPRLWIAFFVHDIGYLGKPNMDGAEGETHVELGAKIMGIFGKKWADFSRYHSRFYAKKDFINPSKLCVADKLAISLTPAWLYLPMVNWTGEIKEYMKVAGNREAAGEQVNKYESMKLNSTDQKEWYKGVQAYLLRWVYAHKDNQNDTWTPETKKAVNASGVWQ